MGSKKKQTKKKNKMIINTIFNLGDKVIFYSSNPEKKNEKYYLNYCPVKLDSIEMDITEGYTEPIFNYRGRTQEGILVYSKNVVKEYSKLKRIKLSNIFGKERTGKIILKKLHPKDSMRQIL